jgi:transposase InsO family protein/transposase-like protein
MGTKSRKESGGRKPKRVTPEDRRAALEAFRKSGLSQVMFARQWGVNPTTFSGWVGRYAREGAKGLEPGAGIAKSPRGRKPWLPEPVKRAVAATKRQFPTFGLQKIKDSLRRFLGLKVSTGSVRKVLAAEGLPTVLVVRRRKRRKSPGPPHPFERARPNQLWQSDITYVDVPWSRKPLYLVAFLDDRSRYVVSFGLHAHQRGEIVLEALAEGISRYGKPQEVLTDQGRQYYAWRGKTDFQRRLRADGIEHAVARAQHPETVGKCERLWKTIQDELWARVILKDLEDARARLKQWVDHYNFQRPHQGIEGATPADRFFGAEEAVKKAIDLSVAHNALRLALGEAPRRPVYLAGQIDGQSVSVHGEAGRVVVQLPSGEVKELEAKDLGVSPQPKKEVQDEHDEERGDDDDDGGEPGAGAGERAGPSGPGGAPGAPGAQAPEVPGAGEGGAAGAGAVAGGERGAARAGAQDGGGGAVDVAGQEQP